MTELGDAGLTEPQIMSAKHEATGRRTPRLYSLEHDATSCRRLAPKSSCPTT